MKKILFAVFIWFLVQLALMSAASTNSSFKAAQAVASGKAANIASVYTEQCDIKNNNPHMGFLAGLIFPLSETNLVKGGWCWEK